MPGTGTGLRVSCVAATIAQAVVRRPSRLARHGILRRDDTAAYVEIGAPLFRRHRWPLRTPWLRIFRSDWIGCRFVGVPDDERCPMTQSALISTPFGAIAVYWSDGHLTRVDLSPAPAPADSDGRAPSWVTDELAAYLVDGQHRPRVPIRLNGTAFQRRVWDLLTTIPAGRTATYGALATELGSGARAVGLACRANPCPLVIPCHRVVGAHGLGGFAGDRGGRLLAIKRWLLDHEGVVFT